MHSYNISISSSFTLVVAELCRRVTLHSASYKFVILLVLLCSFVITHPYSREFEGEVTSKLSLLANLLSELEYSLKEESSETIFVESLLFEVKLD